MATNRRLGRVRVVVGERVRWSAEGSRKWHGNRDQGLQDMDNMAILSAFAANGWDVSAAVIERGRYVICPRCGGSGYYVKGACYRCYGSAASVWVAEEPAP